MNYKTFAFIFISILFYFVIFSCSNKESKLTIPEDKMLKVLFDLYVADNAIKEAPKDIRDSLKSLYTEQIFSIHKLSDEEFEQNLSNLQKYPQKFKKFYDKLDKYAEDLSKEKISKETKQK